MRAPSCLLPLIAFLTILLTCSTLVNAADDTLQPLSSLSRQRIARRQNALRRDLGCHSGSLPERPYGEKIVMTEVNHLDPARAKLWTRWVSLGKDGRQDWWIQFPREKGKGLNIGRNLEDHDPSAWVMTIKAEQEHRSKGGDSSGMMYMHIDVKSSQLIGCMGAEYQWSPRIISITLQREK